jgi:ArsR family transcriptional regulator
MPDRKYRLFNILQNWRALTPDDLLSNRDNRPHSSCAFRTVPVCVVIHSSRAFIESFDYIRIMETRNAIEAFAALAHQQRLAVFRMLVRTGPNGLSAGEIAMRLETPPSSLSFHLTQLERAGLIRSRRESRNVIYAADIEGTRRVISYLTEDCCQGRPEICGDLAVAMDNCGTREK